MKHATLLLLLVACGGDDGNSDGTTPDAPAPDAPPMIDAPPTLAAISARFVLGSADNFGQKTPIEGAAVRIENAAGDVQEAMTAADGTVTFMVEPARGPYDVSFVKLGVMAVSVLDVAAPLGDVQTFPARVRVEDLILQPFEVSGKAMPADPVIVSVPGHAYLPASGPSDSVLVSPLPAPAAVVGLELNDARRPVNIVQTSPRIFAADDPVTLAFPATAPAIVTTTGTITLPTTGVAQASRFQGGTGVAYRDQTVDVGTRVGAIVAPAPVGSTITTSIEAFGGAFAPSVGMWVIETNSLPKYQAFGPMAPTSGATATLPPAEALSLSGADLDAVRITATGAAYAYAEITIAGDTPWRIYAPHADLTARALPHLPTGFTFHDLALASAAQIAVHLETDAAPPWQERRDHTRTRMQLLKDQIATEGR